MTMLHNNSPASTCSCGTQVLPNPSVTTSSHWQPDVPLNISTELPPVHEMISHPARNIWHSRGIPSQCTSSALLYSSSTIPSCSHLVCSDRDTTQRLQCFSSPFQTPRTSPGSPYMTSSHAHGGPSLLGISSAFSGYPLSSQASHVVSSAKIHTISSTHSLCSTVNCGYSQPPLSVQTNSDSSHNQTKSQTPIHLSTTPSAQPQYHTAFSSLTPSRAHTLIYTGYEDQRGTVEGSRQNDPVGSSPVHQTQDLANSLMEQVPNMDSKASLYKERTETMESHSTGDSILDMKERPH